MKRRILIAEIPGRLEGRFPRIAGWGRCLWTWLCSFARTHAPGPRAWRGAALGLVVATVVFVADAFLHMAFLPTPTRARVFEGLWMVASAVAAGIGLVLLAALVSKMPWRYRLALGACGALLSGLFPFSLDGRAAVWGIVAFSLVGAGIASINRADFRAVTTRVQRFAAFGGLVAGLASIVVLGVWIWSDGYDPLEYRNAAVETEASVAKLKLPDPSVPGDYTVLQLTYGSGTDILRREFGRDADLTTETVDGKRLLEAWNDDRGRERKAFFGFDRDELPLQGRVWYPEGSGPFPLVLVVHGNHRMYEFSDPGYEYLGELLASRGFILVSVDENFINGRIGAENDARGWLLLEHLRVWKAWNEDAENPFYGLVDMERIGLIGHSRGGEAVAVAAAFNDLPYYPDDATVEFDYRFNIGAVIAIAPIMGQYRPGGRFTAPRDINYFVFHGANDMDVSSFSGSGQYQQVTFSGDEYRFKSALYVMSANHGQWNTVWGRYDAGRPFARVLNVHALMPEEEQRQIGKVYISAFLEATLRGELGYLPLFADARVGADWLPDTAYLLEFDDSRSVKVATFDEDVDVTTSTLAGGRTWGENLTVWREQMVEMKWATKETAAVYLGWHREEEEGEQEGDEEEAPDESAEEQGSEVEAPDDEGLARYVIELAENFSIDPAGSLIFSMADSDESAERDDEDEEDNEENEEGQDEEDEGEEAREQGEEQHGQQKEGAAEGENKEGEDEEEAEDEDEPREPIDLTIRVVDANGEAADVPLSRFSLLQPQLEVQLRKSFFDDPDTESEPVFQSFIFPLEWFVSENPALDPAQLRRLEFVFDRTDSAVVILDSVGFRPPPGGPESE